MISLEGKTAWITGASKGIGRATAELFARQGANLIINGTDSESLERVSDELAARFGITCIPLCYDVSSSENVKQAFTSMHKEFGRLDILVNNAGIMIDSALGMVKSEHLSRTMEVNVHGVLHHMQLASRWMLRKKEGSIINVSSIVGRVGNSGQTVYSASKSAVIGATYSAAKELAPYGIRVNAVAPGYVETNLTKGFSEEKKQRTLTSIPMGHPATPEDVANVILFLASSLSSYVTGQVIGVDGGMIL